MEERSARLSAPTLNPRPLSMIVPPLALNHTSSVDDNLNLAPPSRRRRSACRHVQGGDLILPPLPGTKRVDLGKERPASVRVGQRSSTPLFKVVNDWKDKRTRKKKRTETVAASVTVEDKAPLQRKRVLVRQPSMSDPNLRGKLPPELLLTGPSSPSSTSDPMSTARIAVSPQNASPTAVASPYQCPSPNGSQTLSTLKKMADKLEGEERDLLVAALVATHEGNPINLFEECLREELASDPQMETLMRLTCPSVCVLHALAKPFRDRLIALITPLIDLASNLTQHDINSLTPPSAPSSPLISACFSPSFPPSSPSQFLRSAPPAFNSSTESPSPFSSSSPSPSSPSISSTLYDCIASLLSPASFLFFPLLHTLAYRATEVVKDTIGGEEDKIHRWALTAILFLRYIVPLVIQSSSSPGPRFVGKLLMKMCTESTFTTDSTCPADQLLSSLSPLFSNFCNQIVEMGEEGQAKSEEKKEKQEEQKEP